MESPRASLLLILGIMLLAVIASAQTTPRRTTNRTVSKPSAAAVKPGGTIKICQGLPIPPGYVITGYITTSSCPHGAYLIKQQHATDPDSSLVANKKENAEAEIPARAKKNETAESATRIVVNKNPNTRPATPTSSSKKQNVSSKVPLAANKKPAATSRSSVAENRGLPQPAEPATSVSRPRRVAVADVEGEAPYLRGVNPPPALGPPTLGNVKSVNAPIGPSSEAASADAVPAGPEEVGEGDVVRIDTALVTVPVSVMDRDGRFVPNLKREDFSVWENGVEQSIVNFEPTEKPFTVALVLDTSASTHFHLWQIKEAAIAFAKQLRPQDRVLVVSFNDEVLLLTEATNDLNVVSAVIIENAKTGDSTRLYDAVDLVIKERLNQIKSRKAIVLFTDGVDTSSYLATYESTMRDIEELDALIYPIQYDTSDYLRAMQGLGTITITTTNNNWPFGGRTTSRVIHTGPTTSAGAALPGTTKEDYERANKYLHELAEKTGARLFQANDPAQLATAFSGIAEELRRQYSLGYYPKTSSDQTVTDNGVERRRIRVRVKKPNLAVRARDSYVRSSSTTPVR